MTLPRAYTEGLEASLARVIAEARREMATVMAEHRATVAEFKAQLVEAKAETESLKAALMDFAGAAVKRAVEALPQPEPVDLSGLATKEDVAEARVAAEQRADEQVRAIVESLQPKEPDPAELAAEIQALQRETSAMLRQIEENTFSAARLAESIPPALDLSAFATREEVEAVRAAIPEVPEPKDWSEDVERVWDLVAEREGILRTLIHETAVRLAEHPGTFPVVKAWEDGVHYEGALVTHDGALWQAQRDTGKAPGHDDWRCIVTAGQDGRSFRFIGPLDQWAEPVEERDVAVVNGSAFLAVQDAPGDCPGDGWRLLASRGSRGAPGEKGPRGEPGARGEPGRAAPAPVALVVDDEDARLTLALDNGETLTADFYPLLAKVAR